MKSEISSLETFVDDNISAMLAYWDKNQICRYANAAYISWFGKTQEEMIDKITIKELLGPLYELNLPYITGVLEGEAQTFEREIPTPKEGLRNSIINYFPDIVNGEVKGFSSHIADITSVKLLEKKLVQSNEIINQQNKHLLNFANIVSHNLKSYANNMGAILDLFINADSEKEKNDMLNYLIEISTGFSSTVIHLTEIVDLQNRVCLKLEPINLYDYIKKIIGILRIQIKSSNVLIQNKVSLDITVLANPAYMESILLNMLTNSIKYRQPNRNPVIELDAYVMDKEMVLSIKDNGLGINLKKHRDNLFGMYKTFHGNADAKGIGLFITKSQIESMGGRIEVESEENKGTTFKIYFKLSE